MALAASGKQASCQPRKGIQSRGGLTREGTAQALFVCSAIENAQSSKCSNLGYECLSKEKRAPGAAGEGDVPAIHSLLHGYNGKGKQLPP